MRLGADDNAEGARGRGERAGKRREAERVALARAGRSLQHENAVCDVPADDFALGRGPYGY